MSKKSDKMRPKVTICVPNFHRPYKHAANPPEKSHFFPEIFQQENKKIKIFEF